MAVLCDAAIFKAYMNISATDTSQDELIDTILAWSDAQVVNMCGQEIAYQSSVTRVFGGNGGPLFTLPNFPVRAVASLKTKTNSTTSTWDYTFTAFGSTSGQYELQGNTLYMPAGFNQGYNNFQVVYSYGYQTIPADVQAVALEMAAIAYRESSAKGKNDPRLGVSSVSTSPVGGITTTKSFLDMMPRWDDRLSSYKYLGTF